MHQYGSSLLESPISFNHINSHNNRGCFLGLGCKKTQSSCSLSSNKAASGSSLRVVNAVVCSNDVELAEPLALQCSGASGSAASIEVAGAGAQVKMYSTNRQAVDRNGVMPERKVKRRPVASLLF